MQTFRVSRTERSFEKDDDEVDKGVERVVDGEVQDLGPMVARTTRYDDALPQVVSCSLLGFAGVVCYHELEVWRSQRDQKTLLSRAGRRHSPCAGWPFSVWGRPRAKCSLVVRGYTACRWAWSRHT